MTLEKQIAGQGGLALRFGGQAAGIGVTVVEERDVGGNEPVATLLGDESLGLRVAHEDRASNQSSCARTFGRRYMPGKQVPLGDNIHALIVGNDNLPSVDDGNVRSAVAEGHRVIRGANLNPFVRKRAANHCFSHLKHDHPSGGCEGYRDRGLAWSIVTREKAVDGPTRAGTTSFAGSGTER